MLALLIAPALATVAKPPAAALEAEVDGRPVALPTLKTDVDARVEGDLATVHLVQTFRNDTGTTLSPRYVFPLPTDAAVYEMTLTTASSTTRAEIRRREEAAALFAQAERDGKKAALLDEQRPNVFTQRVSNLAPGEEVRIELAYAHVVPRRDGAYEWTLPLVVGPRYVPSAESLPVAPLPEGQWTLQPTDLPPLPSTVDPGRVAVTVRIDPGFATAGVTSPSHPLDVRPDGEAHVVSLAEGRVLDNRDLVLTWRNAGEGAAVGTSAWAQAGHGYVSVLVDPPATAAPEDLARRELVFVLDTSCSMRGFPLDASKRFMRTALGGLRPTDRFRLVRFSSDATEFESGPVPADAETVERAAAWIDALEANGGSEVNRGLTRALGPPPDEDRMRIVVLLTDGYIGNEPDIVRQIEVQRGAARIFALGIGASVNRYLVEQVARSGRGVARVVLGPEDAPAAADELARRLAAPYLTDVRIDWGDAPVREAAPAVLPDLFLGEPLRVVARYDAPGRFRVTVHGLVGGRPAALPLELDLPADAAGNDALPIAWARARIEDRTIAWMDPAADPARRDALREEITVLGLEHRLVTPWTSFVAVAPDPPVPAGTAVASATVPTPAPAGVSSGAFGGSWGGNAAPEPATWLGGALLLGLGGLSLRRRVD